MMEPTITVRITCKSLKAFRKFFPEEKGESFVRYFNRLAAWIKEKDKLEREKAAL